MRVFNTSGVTWLSLVKRVVIMHRFVAGKAYIIVACCLVGCTPDSGASADRFSRWRNGGVYAGGSMALSAEHDCLILSSPISGRGDIWQVGLKSDWSFPIVGSRNNEVDPFLASSGDLYFSQFVNGRYCIKRCSSFRRGCVSDPLLTTVVDITDHALSPVLLPDESALLFVKRPVSGPASLSELWQISMTSGEMSQLTVNTIVESSVSCFSDSRRLLYCRDYSHVYIIDIKPGTSEYLCEGNSVQLSLDNESLYIVRRHSGAYKWDLIKRGVSTGVETAYSYNGSFISAMCALPDDKVAVVSNVFEDNVGQLLILDIDTGEWKPGSRLLNIGSLKR